MSVTFSNKLINWYNHNKRDLPWRKTKDPYKIWVSEIILQQTRIEFGIKYYNKFLKRYPDVKNLANTQTKGSTKTTCTKELNDAIEANAANTLMCPTLETRLGMM